jgi:drug/metabolite transporter (DMT)-like permease
VQVIQKLSKSASFIVLTLVFSAGVTPIAIRIAQGEGMPSLVIVFIRLWLVSLGLFPVVWSRYREQIFRLTMREYILGTIAGFWLALNLFMLFLALENTSVLVSSVLRRTTPLWIVFPEVLLLGAVFTRRIWLSLLLTLMGVLLIAVGGDRLVELGNQPLLGAGMATFGAICLGVYLLIGRRLSTEMPVLLYSFLVFAGAAIVATVFVWGTRTPLLGYPLPGYLWTLIVTVLAQVLGHLVINLGLRQFSATAMGIILQVGVVVSTVIALIVFQEIPTLPQVIGSILIVGGVILATVEQSRRLRKPALTL